LPVIGQGTGHISATNQYRIPKSAGTQNIRRLDKERNPCHNSRRWSHRDAGWDKDGLPHAPSQEGLAGGGCSLFFEIKLSPAPKTPRGTGPPWLGLGEPDGLLLKFSQLSVPILG
jgi:hypothetical protein